MKGIGIKKEEIKSIFDCFHSKHKEMRDILLELIKVWQGCQINIPDSIAFQHISRKPISKHCLNTNKNIRYLGINLAKGMQDFMQKVIKFY